MRKVWAIWLLLITGWLPLAAAGSLPTEKESLSRARFGFNKKFIGGLNITQTSFSNWAAGGENSLAYTATVDTRLENNQKSFNWSIGGKFAFGQVQQGKAEMRNAVDRIEIRAKYVRKLGFLVNPYIESGFDTQFTTGYDYSKKPKQPKSDFMDPAYITLNAGAAKSLLPNLKTRFGFGFKETITRRFNVYADNPKTPEVEKRRFETGLSNTTELEAKINKNLLFSSKLELFSNLKGLEAIDVRWDSTVSAKVAKYVAVNLNVLVYYDADVTKKTQIKEGLAIGLTYRLF